MGGIIPPVARDLHKQHVENIVNLALERASVSAAVSSNVVWNSSAVCEWCVCTSCGSQISYQTDWKC